jgi:hypothetical protein
MMDGTVLILLLVAGEGLSGSRDAEVEVIDDEIAFMGGLLLSRARE